MLKSLSAAMLALSLLAAPAFAGAGYVKTDATVAKSATAKPASTSAATQVKLTPKVANAFARHGGRHHMRGHVMRRHHHHFMGRHHHMRRHHMHHHMRMHRR